MDRDMRACIDNPLELKSFDWNNANIKPDLLSFFKILDRKAHLSTLRKAGSEAGIETCGLTKVTTTHHINNLLSP